MEKMDMNWGLVATIHFLIAGLIIPFVATSIAYLIFYLVGIEANGLAALIVIPLVLFVSIWIGVKYSGKFISRKFDLANRTKIINFSSFGFVILVVVFTYGLVAEMMTPGISESEFYTISALMIAISIAEIVIFYRDSIRYIN